MHWTPIQLEFASIISIMKATTAITVLVHSTLVLGHGFVQQIWLGDSLVDCWDPYKDPQKKPPVNVITRKFLDNGPVTDGNFTVRANFDRGTKAGQRLITNLTTNRLTP
jgi:hypothetical protein